MRTETNGGHFKVECQIDGEWFESDYVFPDRGAATAYKQHEESYGSGNLYRVVPTDDPVSLPPVEGGDEDESPDEDDPSFSLDWTALHELSILCPTTLCRPSDGDLERIYSQCQDGCPLQGRVFS